MEGEKRPDSGCEAEEREAVGGAILETASQRQQEGGLGGVGATVPTYFKQCVSTLLKITDACG